MRDVIVSANSRIRLITECIGDITSIEKRQHGSRTYVRDFRVACLTWAYNLAVLLAERRAPLLSKRGFVHSSGRDRSVDILVKTAGVRAGVGPHCSSGGVDGATLVNIGTVLVRIATLAEIEAGDGVAIARPFANREAPEGGYPHRFALADP